MQIKDVSRGAGGRSRSLDGGGCRVERLEQRALLSATLPRPDHVVVVVEEDHSYDQILGDPATTQTTWPWVAPEIMADAPYIRGLASNGASFTHAHSVAHPSRLTYQALFSGLTPKASDQPWAHPYTAPNLGSELIAAGLSFGGYSESLPRTGYAGDDVGDYKRNHNPWVDFANVPAADNLPFSKFPEDNFSALPTVSFVVPNLQDNMHSNTVQDADNWLHDNVGEYAKWATQHNSLLIVTWDEGHTSANSIPTLFYGPMVAKGRYPDPISQPNILRTLEGMYGLAPTGTAVQAAPITDIFGGAGASPTVSSARSRHGGAIRGVVFNDHVGTGRPSRGNPGIAGTFVYLDLNGDETFEAGEPSVETDGSGRFVFRHLPAGSYTVRVVPHDGYTASAPTSGTADVVVQDRHRAPRLLFGEQPVV